MTIHFRRKLFGFFIVLFIIIGIGVVLYSQGYRLDTNSFSLTKIGAVYIESYQSPINIYLNDTYYKDKSGLLTKGTLLASIIPQKYRLSIQKDGFLEYTKNIEVSPSQVTRFFNVLLVPQNIAYATSTIASSSSTVLDALTTQGAIAHETTARGTQYTLLTIPNLTTATPTSLSINKTLATVSKQKFSQFLFYSNNPSELLATSSVGTYRINLGEPSVTFLASSTLPYAYTIQDNFLTFVSPQLAATTTKTKQIKETNPLANIIQLNISSGATTSVTLTTPQRVGTITSLYAKNNYLALITTDKSLILYNNDSHTEIVISQNALSALFSPDAKKLLYRTVDGKIHIYFIKDELEIMDAKAGDDITLSLIDTSHIQTMVWYQDSTHLIVTYPNQIKIAEVTQKEPNEQFTLWNGPYRLVAYAPDQNLLTIAISSTEMAQIDFKLFVK